MLVRTYLLMAFAGLATHLLACKACPAIACPEAGRVDVLPSGEFSPVDHEVSITQRDSGQSSSFACEWLESESRFVCERTGGDGDWGFSMQRGSAAMTLAAAPDTASVSLTLEMSTAAETVASADVVVNFERRELGSRGCPLSCEVGDASLQLP